MVPKNLATELMSERIFKSEFAAVHRQKSELAKTLDFLAGSQYSRRDDQ
jgi:hypothetical protein